MSTQTANSSINLPHLQLIQVPGGTFMMGSEGASAYLREKPVHTVTVADFELAAFPVTQALWEAVMGKGSNPSYFAGLRRPVERVSWYDAVAFCNQLNRLLGQACCYFSDKKCTRPYALKGKLINRRSTVFYQAAAGAFRLPTEAEWEYAARGGPYQTSTEYAGSDRLKDCAWYGDNSGDETQPPGLLQPNALGLYDMSGNVWEWCWGWYGVYTQTAQKNPNGPQEGMRRVVRGGTWNDFLVRVLRVSLRNSYDPNYHYVDIGFRLARHLTL